MVAGPKQFDICENLGINRDRVPLLVVIQHAAGNVLETRLAVPLMPAARRQRLMEKIEPVIAVDGVEHTAVVAQIRALPLADFGKVVASAASDHYALQNALDFLVAGY